MKCERTTVGFEQVGLKPLTVTRKYIEKSYKYISSVDYINNLKFDYIETYSFQRGIEYKENLKAIRPEYDELKE